MKLSIYSPAIVALLGFMLVNLSPLHGADAAAPKAKKIPFHGAIVAVDTAAQTITVGGTKRVFHVTPETKITDGSGAASTLAAAVVGEDSGGSYDKATMNLYSLRLGAKTGEKTASEKAATPITPPTTSAPAPNAPATPAPATTPATAAPVKATAAPTTAAVPTETKAKKQSFSGKVVSVDAAGGTLVVHGKADQTFTVTAETKITGAAGLGAITAGTHVSGSYTKSADGATLTVSAITVK
jgi:hypothetical protein